MDLLKQFAPRDNLTKMCSAFTLFFVTISRVAITLCFLRYQIRYFGHNL